MQRLTWIAGGAFGGCVCLALLAADARAAVTWNLQAGSSYTLLGETTQGFLPTLTWPTQSAGSATSMLSGSFTTTNTFLTALNFGPEQQAPADPDPDNYAGGENDPQFIADLQQWATVTLPNWANTSLGIGYTNSASASPGPMPLAVPPIPQPFPNPPAEPAVFGVMVNTPFNPTGEPAAFRDNRTGFFTNTTDANPSYGDDAAYFPNGAPLDPVTGQFDAAAAGIISFTNLDVRLTNLGYVGRVPTRGDDGNVAAAPGVISRNGASYVMTLPFALSTFLVDPSGEDDRHDRIDFPGDVDPPSVSGLYIWVGGSGTLTAVANVVPGDANFDGVVDIFDVNVVSDNWGGAGDLTPGDVNGDGTVDIFDVNMISDNWGETLGGGAASVPEPSSLILLVAAGTAALGWARRRTA